MGGSSGGKGGKGEVGVSILTIQSLMYSNLSTRVSTKMITKI